MFMGPEVAVSFSGVHMGRSSLGSEPSAASMPSVATISAVWAFPDFHPEKISFSSRRQGVNSAAPK
jgi:hypothetical protein